ncbi:MAG: glutathione peroxidase [Alphaproteobacteria bacterium]|nr:glutathione peroxidase [Alphaproteobacteria bacterium]
MSDTIDYRTPVVSLSGEPGDLTPYQGKVLLVVNTASHCGFTPQFEGLEALWRSHADAGLVVLGFPCNQFGKQEPGTADEIGAFCQKNYGVSFPMHDKIEVNGDHAHPLFRQLKAAAPGLLGSRGIKWNFTKFLVARDGTVLRRFGPRDTPAAIEGAITAALRG